MLPFKYTGGSADLMALAEGLTEEIVTDWPASHTLLRLPGWCWAVPFFNAYRKGDYGGARTFAVKFNMPGFYFTQAIL